MAEQLSDFDDLWNYDDPAETETRFRELLPAAEESGDPNYHMQLLTQIARTHSLRRQFDEAHAILDQVEPHLAVDPVVEVRCLLERGRTYNSSGQPQKARALFVQVWDRAREAQADFFAVDAAHMVAIVEAAPDQQLAWNRKGLELAEQSDQPRVKKWLGSLYNNVGWTYHDNADYEQALDSFQKALDWREKQGDTNLIRIARWSVGRALRSLNRIDEALEMQQDLLAEYETIGEKDGFVFEELAECLLLLERSAEAKPYFAQAYTELSQMDWLAASEPERIQRLQQLSQ